MHSPSHRTLSALWLLPLACLLVTTGCGGKLDVELAAPRKGEIRESFTEPARTRLAQEYPISMPVAGRVARIDLEPGDRVKAGQALVNVDLVPFREAASEARASVEELKARLALNRYHEIEDTIAKETRSTIEAAEQAVKAAYAQVEAEQARTDRAGKELERAKELKGKNAITETEFDDRALAAETSLIELRKQEFYRAATNAIFTAVKLGPEYIEKWLGRKDHDRDILTHQLKQAEARLARAEHDLGLASIRSPIDGVVLQRHELGDRTLQAGARLLLLGKPEEDLEVIADVLTQDAMRLPTGSEVRMEPAAGLVVVMGKVKRIEPAGFTKLSSLGVEQQRVNVIVEITAPHQKFGVGYRLQAQFLTGIKADALIVPRFSVLQAPDRSFYVLKVESGKLKKQIVKIGLRSDLEMELLNGLTQNDSIVAKPDTTMKEGRRVSDS